MSAKKPSDVAAQLSARYGMPVTEIDRRQPPGPPCLDGATVKRLRELLPVPIRWKLVDSRPATRVAVITGYDDGVPIRLCDYAAQCTTRADLMGGIRSTDFSAATWVSLGERCVFSKTVFPRQTGPHDYQSLMALVEDEMLGVLRTL